MAEVEFTTDKNDGYLTWLSAGHSGPNLTTAEAAVVAAAEQAAALRAIAAAIHQLAEAVNGLQRTSD